jgi:phosphohistidine phosphatase SixA
MIKPFAVLARAPSTPRRSPHGIDMVAPTAPLFGRRMTWRQGLMIRIIFVFTLPFMAPVASADDSLWEKLQRDPNMVVLLRNMESSGNRDGANMLVWDASGNCEGESVLTEKGRAHARRIGEAFAGHGVTPTVISSPMCRCRETSRIAFGEYMTDPDLRQTAGEDGQREEIFQFKASALLSKYRGKRPVVFVNHRPNIDSLTMELLDIGDLLIGTISENGEIDVLGKIRVAP